MCIFFKSNGEYVILSTSKSMTYISNINLQHRSRIQVEGMTTFSN